MSPFEGGYSVGIDHFTDALVHAGLPPLAIVVGTVIRVNVETPSNMPTINFVTTIKSVAAQFKSRAGDVMLTVEIDRKEVFANQIRQLQWFTSNNPEEDLWNLEFVDKSRPSIWKATVEVLR